MIKVVYVLRVKNPVFFSIERVFSIVNAKLQQFIQTEVVHVVKPGIRIKNLLYLRGLASRQPKHTIYHVTGDIHYAVFALPKQHVVLTIHDCVFLEQHKGVKKWMLKKMLLDWPVRYTPVITAISEKTKIDIIRFTGCKPDKIRVINNPLSPCLYFRKKTFNASRPQLLFLGSTPNKNLERVIAAIKDIPCILLIIGKPDPHQLELLNESKISFVIEAGLTDEALADRYSDADIILFPSLYEGFGLPVTEGFKAGRAVLTSNLEPMKTIAENAAWLADPYDTSSIRNGIMSIISNGIEREQKINAGLTIAEKYNADYIAGEYHLLYKEVYKKLCAE